MNITVTLFSGRAGWAITVLAFIGAVSAFRAVTEWLGDRLEVDVKRFRIRRRWDRPSAIVDLGDGREAAILYVLRDGDAAEPMALVQPYDDDEVFTEPEWVATSRLTPRTSRERGMKRALIGYGRIVLAALLAYVSGGLAIWWLGPGFWGVLGATSVALTVYAPVAPLDVHALIPASPEVPRAGH